MIVLIALTVVIIVLSTRWYWTKLKVILNLNIPTFQNFLPIIGHGHKLIGLSAEGIKHLPSPDLNNKIYSFIFISRTIYFFE